MKSRQNILAILFFTSLMLAACGIRPGSLESPAEGGDDFPHVYPAEETISK